jgi:pimeloyl-ACP methyl ester carboxylesterase
MAITRGPTRILSSDTPRSGEQAALGADLLALMDSLRIGKAILGGYDWGGRAACIAAALWPERVTGLVSAGAGYNIQDIAGAAKPGSPDQEARDWYQYYFHTERGRKGLEQKRREIARFLGRPGRRHGPSMTQHSSEARPLSTIPTSLMW